MSTNTAIFAFIKPNPGGDTNAWGTLLNANFDKLDAMLNGGVAFQVRINFADNGMRINGAVITSSVAELNILDGALISTAQLNALVGITASVAEINLLDGVLASTAELNILNGALVTFSELNILAGTTVTTAELNILDGVVANATEINLLDGAVDHNNAAWIAGTAVTRDLPSPKDVADSAKARSLGEGQTWQVVTRLQNVVYQNATGRTIVVSAIIDNSEFQVSADGVTNFMPVASDSGGDSVRVNVVIPSGWYYRYTGFTHTVYELR